MYISLSKEKSILEISPVGTIMHDNVPKGYFNGKNAIILGKKHRLPLKAGEWKDFAFYADLLDSIPLLVICTKDEVLKTNALNKAKYETKEVKGYTMYIIPRDEFVYAQVKGVNA